MGSHESFLKSIRHRAEAPPTVTAPKGVGLGADADQYEIAVSDPARTARMIVAAAALRDGGGPPTAKLSSTAEAILRAGARRRGES
jgi:hypothetical protein